MNLLENEKYWKVLKVDHFEINLLKLLILEILRPRLDRTATEKRN